jgi:hypothetical protein
MLQLLLSNPSPPKRLDLLLMEFEMEEDEEVVKNLLLEEASSAILGQNYSKPLHLSQVINIKFLSRFDSSELESWINSLDENEETLLFKVSNHSNTLELPLAEDFKTCVRILLTAGADPYTWCNVDDCYGTITNPKNELPQIFQGGLEAAKKGKLCLKSEGFYCNNFIHACF